MKRFRIRVQGKVQGVFFRVSTQEEAKKLGLTGWVRNELDGSVLIEAEGELSDIDKLIAWCKIGPTASDVSGVNADEIETLGSSTFKITY